MNIENKVLGDQDQEIKVDASPSVKTYKLLRGKHSYINAKGEKVVARKGDSVPLTPKQLKVFGDKFATKHVGD